jgi:hypothetical protein
VTSLLTCRVGEVAVVVGGGRDGRLAESARPEPNGQGS